MKHSQHPKFGRQGIVGGPIEEKPPAENAEKKPLALTRSRVDEALGNWLRSRAQSALAKYTLTGKIRIVDFIATCAQIEATPKANSTTLIAEEAKSFSIDSAALTGAIDHYLRATRAEPPPAKAERKSQSAPRPAQQAASRPYYAQRREPAWARDMSELLDETVARQQDAPKVQYDSAGEPIKSGRKQPVGK